MEVRITISSLALGIPKTGFGFNIASGAYVEVRAGQAATRHLYGMTDLFSLGTKSGTLGFGHIQTPWLYVDPAKNASLNTASLNGAELEIAVTGALIGSGKVDVVLSKIDEHGQTTELLNLKSVKVPGASGQLSSTSIRNKAKFMKVLPAEE
ncbi:hypothetical protein WH50_05540 [Pokkaliibacter plantistimulans]|uniref:Uncharacterized protein n=1 Tax=Pokkaliibacter plantistimulans TaxID=1635171 RepID=A0ABX5LZU3_9GAMM|nr:hypothetical protein [Pokkaliibacter plantistimulans]PXF32194.1 hypothetical protein WH50_05540 [Pokkaliibacter plantistimulans]